MHHRRVLSTFLPRDIASLAALEVQLKPLLPPPAAALLETGLLTRLQPDLKKGKVNRIFARSEMKRVLNSAKTDADRHESSVAMTFVSKRLSMLLRDYCDTCCYTRARCICNALEPRMRSKHTLWLFQNVGEFGRQNSSGRLLTMLLENSKISTQGLQCEVDEIMQHVEQHRDSSVVLFPSPDAITIGEYQTKRVDVVGADAAGRKPLTIFVPDGTSRQAKNMEKHLPSFLPRVRLNTIALRSWLDPIRRQTEEHRVCTAQAGAAVLAELGEVIIAERVKELVHLFVERTEKDRMMLGAVR